MSKQVISSGYKLLLAGLLSLSAFAAKGQAVPVVIYIDTDKTYQTINNFAASDAWACQYAGNWPDEKRNKIADLLFSLDNNQDGSPKGIGLSLWRFNFGAGSAQQGAESGIKDEWHRAESFLNADGSYNWQNQAGQVWFLKAAKARGVKQFLGFFNSPPVNFTLNHKSFAQGGRVNIGADKYGAFAKYTCDIISGLQITSKVKFDYISPVNEPQWDWSDGKQEGCPYNNAEIAGLAKALNSELVSYKLDAKIVVAEAGSIKYLYTAGDKAGKGNQVNDFFDAASGNYLGNLPKVSKTIAAHSYFSTSPISSAIRARKMLADTVAAKPGLAYWQSEYCVLGDNEGEINGARRDLGIDAALYVASVIHTDLTVANASAWQWWLAVSPYDYKDGLVYIDKNKTDGNIYPSKMLWVLGNYSRFVRPGAVRVGAETNLQQNGLLMVSAFKNRREITVVVINKGSEDVAVSLRSAKSKIKFTSAYLTAQNAELKAAKITGGVQTIPARSVVTIVGTVK